MAAGAALLLAFSLSLQPCTSTWLSLCAGRSRRPAHTSPLSPFQCLRDLHHPAHRHGESAAAAGRQGRAGELKGEGGGCAAPGPLSRASSGGGRAFPPPGPVWAWGVSALVRRPWSWRAGVVSQVHMGVWSPAPPSGRPSRRGCIPFRAGGAPVGSCVPAVALFAGQSAGAGHDPRVSE